MQKKLIWRGTLGLWLQVTLKPSIKKMIFAYAGTNKTKTNDSAVIRTIQSNIVTKAQFREGTLGLHE